MEPTIESPADESAPEVFRFDIKSLMLLTFVCAASVVIVDKFSIFGTVALFILSGIASIYLLDKHGLPTRAFWIQSMWGIIMPLACLATDPFVFSEPGTMPLEHEGLMESGLFRWRQVGPVSAACYLFMLWQMMLLVASWFLLPHQASPGAWLAGNFVAGLGFAAIMGLILILPAIMFSIMLVGLPGLTPWFTFLTLRNAGRRCWKIAELGGNSQSNYLFVILGFLTSAVVWLSVLFLWISFG